MEVEKVDVKVNGKPRQRVTRVKPQPQKEDLKMEAKEAKKATGKKAEKETKSELFLKAVRGSKGLTMGEAKNLPWNTKKITFYRLSKRLIKEGLLTIKDGKFFAKEGKKESRPATSK